MHLRARIRKVVLRFPAVLAVHLATRPAVAALERFYPAVAALEAAINLV